MSGAGNMPLGLGPYGLGTPAVAAPQGGATLSDHSGVQRGSRFIHPVTRDFAVDANGHKIGMNDKRQLVQLAVSTELGSASVRSLGNRLKSIVRISDNFAKQVDNVLRTALAHLTNKNTITILSIDVNRLKSQGGAYARLRWMDPDSGDEFAEDVK